MTGDLIDQGLKLMLVGMGTVFVFLSTLVVAMRVMSGLVRRLTPAPIPASAAADADQVAAVAAAVEHHRRSIQS
jgi:oxaloacetate decarboxylase gamma subunit